MPRQLNSAGIRELDTARRPFVLIWEVTQACELACKHCRADAQRRRHPMELTTEEAMSLLDDIASFGKDQILVLSGGDPLFRPDLFDILAYGRDIGLQMTLTPSGTSSLTPAVIKDIADLDVRRLALSLDGASAARHDAFRQEDGSFASTIAAAEAAGDHNLPLQINTTVCQETVDELPDVSGLVSELGAVLWSVFFLVPVGRGQALEPVSPERAESVMEWLLTAGRELDLSIKTTEAPHYRRVALQSQHHQSDSSRTVTESIDRRSGIGAGDGFAFISHTGDVFPSGFLPHAVGNVREESIVDIYREAPLFQQLRDTDMLQGKCGACEFRQICGGSRSRAYATTGDPLASDPLCPYQPTTGTVQSD